MSNPQKLFDEISQFISESRAMLTEEGAVTELAGLDEQVHALCEQALQLTGEERIQYADKLSVLLGDLKNLGEELSAQRDAMFGEIQGLGQHRKASVQYRQIQASDLPKDEDE